MQYQITIQRTGRVLETIEAASAIEALARFLVNRGISSASSDLIAKCLEGVIAVPVVALRALALERYADGRADACAASGDYEGAARAARDAGTVRGLEFRRREASAI